MRRQTFRKPKDIFINGKRLSTILEDHLHWLNKDVDGWENMRADLSYAYLRMVDLYKADLRGAIIRYADMCGAELYGANFSGADLWSTHFQKANLRNADLSNADIRWSDFSKAVISGTNFTNAKISDTYYLNSNIKDICPRYGSFIGYKKCIRNGEFYIVELEVPKNAKRTSSTSNLCRCNKANVNRIYNIDGVTESDIDYVYSSRNSKYKYKVGNLVTTNSFNNHVWNKCGIHFFMSKKDAIDNPL